LSESVRAQYLAQFGPLMWRQRERAVEKLWEAIRARINRLDVAYNTARLYQDGLPVCGFEEQIVRQLAQAGSCNHQLLLELIGKGATLMGTEDPQLLIQEYQMQQQCAASPARADQARGQQAAQAQTLLEARDRFIAQRIAETLAAGETGLVFLGAAHRLEMSEFPDVGMETLECAPFSFQ
jgi:pheromone shutdown protein TraB